LFRFSQPPRELTEGALERSDLVGLDFSGFVEQHMDGNTIAVRSGRRRFQVRLLGIDAPVLRYRGRSQSPWAELALRRLQFLAPRGARVRLVTDRQAFDQYGRLLAYVLRGQCLLNLELVQTGLAVIYQIAPNLAFLPQMEAATAAAQAARRGIWGLQQPLSLLPYEFRRQVDGRPSTKFCGDTRSRRYYQPHEFQRVPVSRRVFFFTEAEALAFGYTPVAAPAALTGMRADGRYEVMQPAMPAAMLQAEWLRRGTAPAPSPFAQAGAGR
jgi:endonuclease YncB( thermonuclease family)